jgi:ketol-acid reductoisomerase
VSDRLSGVRVAVLGFGNQGEAQALNLRSAGVEVVVGAREGAGAARARSLGFPTLPLLEAARSAGVIAALLPDQVIPPVWGGLASALRSDQAVVFAHGFALLYGGLEFPEAMDVVLVSPTAPGAELRRAGERGEHLPAYVAVHRDGTGQALGLARDWAARIGCRPTLDTTVREETEVDLFGEQTVLCGGMNALVLAAFEILVARGYSPAIAYLECVHQLRYLAALLHDRGLDGFRDAISGTARYGDLTRGPRVIGEASRREMAAILEEIRNGDFAREWLAEVAAGGTNLERLTRVAAGHPIVAARSLALGEGPAEPGDGEKSRNSMSKN